LIFFKTVAATALAFLMAAAVLAFMALAVFLALMCAAFAFLAFFTTFF